MMKRSRIAIRWSTDPEAMGYGTSPAPERLPGPPDKVTSPAGALAYREEVIGKVGQGTFIRFDLLHQGRPVTWDEIAEAVVPACPY